MKKEYIKPMIVFEDFKMSSSIAGDCAVTTDSPSRDTCGYVVNTGTDFGAIKVFLEGMECDMPAKDDGTYGVCYHVPFGNTLFNS